MRSNQISRTSLKIARHVLFVAQDKTLARVLPEHVGRVTNDLLVAADLFFPLTKFWLGNRWARGIFKAAEKALVPGFSLYVALRKRWFDDQVRVALNTGAAQVLVVGAGFDTLAVRLASLYPDVAFFEIDHPATQQVKQRACEQLNLNAQNICFIEADLDKDPLHGRLSAESLWNRHVPTVVIAEGLLMYLDQRIIGRVLSSIAAHTGSSSRLLCSCLGADDHGTPKLGKTPRLAQATLRAFGEPVRWCAQPDTTRILFSSMGYDIEHCTSCVGLRTRYLEPLGLASRTLADVEYLVSAKIADGS